MKPKVICHIMSSVDGRIQVERWTAPADGAEKSDLMKTYSEIGQMLHADAWTFGKNTVRDIFHDKTSIFPMGEKDMEMDTPVDKTSVYIGRRSSKRIFISFDPEADIIYTASQLRECDIAVVLDMSTATPRYLTYLRKMGISYIVVEDIMKLGSVLETLNKEFGIRSISLQGGGTLNGAMLNKGLINELSIVVYPGLDCNKNSASIFDNTIDSFVGKQSLTLQSVQQKDNGIIWLRYKVSHADMP